MCGAVVVAIWGLETDFGGDTGRLQTLGALESNKFLSEAFEDRIDSGRKRSVIARFKLRDFRPQLVGASFAVRRSFHSRVVRTESCASQRTRVFKVESNYSQLAVKSHDVFAATMPIWECTGHKASLIVPLLILASRHLRIPKPVRDKAP